MTTRCCGSRRRSSEARLWRCQPTRSSSGKTSWSSATCEPSAAPAEGFVGFSIAVSNFARRRPLVLPDGGPTPFSDAAPAVLRVLSSSDQDADVEGLRSLCPARSGRRARPATSAVGPRGTATSRSGAPRGPRRSAANRVGCARWYRVEEMRVPSQPILWSPRVARWSGR